MITEWNETKRDYPRDKCIHELFEAQVERTPDGVAVVFEEEQLTYRELNQRANRLAHYLKALGVGSEVLVGICVERSLEMVVGLLGILKAGGGYVPLDSAYPKERLAFMLEDTQAPVLLTQQGVVERLPKHGARVVCLDTGWQAIERESEQTLVGGVTADNLAYVIYTSGSTGRPKGVMIPHSAICNHMFWMQEEFPVDETDRVIQKTPFSFDASVWEFFAPLFAGAVLVMARAGGHQDSSYLVRLIAEKQVTVLQLVPSLLQMLLEEKGIEKCRSLRHVFCGGEALSRELVERFFEKLPVELHNLYGPTEASIDSTFWRCTRESNQQSIPIGRPVANMQAHVLDANLQPAPIGVPGELHVGGGGLARGYLNRPELTAEKFISNPFSNEPSARLYKTGDLARYLPDGNIEFLGRIDYQVKIRGFRIELGEIEAALRQHPAVRETVVVAREDAPGEKRLVAYVIPKLDFSLSTNELRSLLREKLPDHMAPSVFVFLDALPLTPNGKVDRRSLPAPDKTGSESAASFVPPRTPVEKLLAGIWSEVLKVGRVGANDTFLELGGHSLKAAQIAARVRDALQMELPLRTLFEASTLGDLAQVLERDEFRAHNFSIPTARRNGDFPLSCSQERLWFIQQLSPDNIAYHFQAALRFTGLLNTQALEKSLSEMVRRHEILRTTFPAIDGRPVQVIHEAQPVRLPVIDLRQLPQSERESATQGLIDAEIQKGFDLTRLPLIRWTLLKLSQHEHILVHVEHHLLHDGWSLNVLVRELLEIYKAFSAGNPSPLPELPIQFADFACWQRQWLHGEVTDAQLAYWKKKLAGSPPVLELPSDHPRPAVRSFQGTAPRVELPPSLCESLRHFSRQQGGTLFMTMLTAFVTLLHRYTGEADICVGSGIANRRWRETEGLLGMIINNLVLRTDLSGNPTARELLRRVREITLEAYAHQDVPFDKVVEAIQPKRDLSRNPLFQVMFGFQDAPPPDVDLPELTVDDLLIVGNGSAKFDLNVIVVAHSQQGVGLCRETKAEGLTLVWEYSTDLFDDATMTRMARHYQTLLEGIVTNPEQRLSQLPLLTEAERHQLLGEWNETKRDYPRDKCIHELFEAQAERSPEAVAVVVEDQQLTYRELNRRANRLARYLQKLGVGPETLVGICMERSLEMVVGILGILKTGGAYVPLDPGYPKERLAFMLEDAQMSVLLTQRKLLEQMPGVSENPKSKIQNRTVCLDTGWEAMERESEENPVCEAAANNLAYVIYTSGSTGRPKGVCVTHRGVVRLVKETNYIELTEKDVFLQFAPISFDASTFEIWAALLNGAKLVLFPPYTPTLEELGEVVKRSGITMLWLTAALFHQMVEEHIESLSGVRQLLAGGDVLSVLYTKKVIKELPGVRLINGYGPTENTTFTCCYPMITPEQVGDFVSIGCPVANTQVYILDSYHQPVPVGIPGELYIGGDGLARGYLNRPDLTAEKFIPNPFSSEPGARLYKTGDLARYLPDGNIQFLGRHLSVRETVVLAREESGGEENLKSADKRLVAYVVPYQGQALTVDGLRSFLKQKLPEYMVPSAFVFLDALPLTPNGKVDRRALPVPDQTRPELESSFVAPRTPVEEALARIWAEVLKLKQVGVHDNFFDLGGHSLLATQVMSRVCKTFQLDLPLRTFFEAPTVAQLAQSIEAIEWVAQGTRNSFMTGSFEERGEV